MVSPFVINVGRQLGSGGREIGRRLAEHFGIAYYDKEILSLAAEESGLGSGIFERSDERKGFFRSIAQVVQPFLGGGGSFYDNQLSDENLFTIQSRVIQKMAADHSCVFIGRVADYILRHHPHHLNVFITADMNDRILQMVERRGVDTKTARRILEEADEERSAYYNFYSSGTWGAADTYDLCINSSLLGLDGTTEFIARLVEQRFGDSEK